MQRTGVGSGGSCGPTFLACIATHFIPHTYLYAPPSSSVQLPPPERKTTLAHSPFCQQEFTNAGHASECSRSVMRARSQKLENQPGHSYGNQAITANQQSKLLVG
ncbi:hypothetical protein CDAR_432501 [Caerostris darwini]|uniref:Uncharacterized protein n=1 Tax=Caerostris darwini TaxID=1538125 RepID=A0AAV4U343_9ARAC|nr:hypothetical protein CDAR_432501 [Caerostris darwini]